MSKQPIKFRLSAFVVTYVMMFVVLALFGYYASGKTEVMQRIFPPKGHRFATDMTTYDLPSMTVSMGGGQGGGGPVGSRIRLDVSLEVASKDVDIINGFQPGISEKINAYVLRLQPDEVMRRGAVPWLRAELLHQVNLAGAPVRIHDLYFRQFLVM